MSTIRASLRPACMFHGEGILWDAAYVAAGSLLMALCSRIALPLPGTPVPITFQTFGVMLLAICLGARRASLALLVYLLEGAAGLPVFQPWGLPGAAHFFGPTAGYLLAYPLAAFLIGWVLERGSLRTPVRLGAALLTGEVTVFAIGCLWLVALFGFRSSASLHAGLYPFLPGELLKMALAFTAARSLSR
jgi:biotin transport system substrate-specific component